MDNKLRMLSEKFVNEQTGEQVRGITIMVDGQVKQVLDLLIAQNEEYKDYTEVVRDALFAGISDLIRQTKERTN